MIMIDKNNISINYENIIKEILEYLDEHNFCEFSPGRHEIDGDRLYVNVLEYDTKPDEQCIWEAHRLYYDLHYIISGQETIKIGQVESDKVISYNEEQDYVALTADARRSILCKAGDIVFLDSDDAHLTGSMSDKQASHVKKAVFKIRIK